MTTSIYLTKKLFGKIYLTTNIVNGMQYVGQTIRINDISYKGSGTLLKEAFKKYGKDNFIVEILDICYSHDQLNRSEIFWIQQRNTFWPDGYNLAPGSIGCNSIGNKSKRRYNNGKVHRYFFEGEETSDFVLGTLNSTKKKMSLITKQNVQGKNHPGYGKKRSLESKRKQSKAMKGKMLGEKNPNFGKTGKNSFLYGTKWFNNGKIQVQCLERDKPDGFVSGRLESTKENQRGSNHWLFGVMGKDNPNYGSKRSIKTRQKQSLKRKEYIKTPKGQKDMKNLQSCRQRKGQNFK